MTYRTLAMISTVALTGALAGAYRAHTLFEVAWSGGIGAVVGFFVSRSKQQ